MTDVDDFKQDQQIRRLAPQFRLPPSVTDPSGPAAEELLQNILRMSKHDVQPRRVWFAPRRMVFAIPAAAMLAALVYLVVVAQPLGGTRGQVVATGPSTTAPSATATPSLEPRPLTALKISRNADFVEIRIVDPVADPERYKQELAAYGIDVEISLVPAKPGDVGRVVFTETGDPGTGPDIQFIEAPGSCDPKGSCDIGIRVPLTYKTYARIVFGRTPLPGEFYEGDPASEQVKESIIGKHVSEALAILQSKGMTASYRVGPQQLNVPADQVPGTWIVFDASPIPGNVMVIWVSEDGKQPRR